MAHRGVDVSPWNLSMSLLALAACGPVIPGAEAETDGTSETQPTDPTDATEPTDPSATTEPPSECEVDSDCGGYGYFCLDGYCHYECLGCCGAQVQDDDQFRCSTWYYECYSNEECNEGEVCELGYCVEGPAPGCDAVPVFAGSIDLSFGEGLPITRLGYAASTVGPGPQLLAARGDTVGVATSEGGSVVITTSGPVGDFVVGDVDGDGLDDVVTVSGGDSPSLASWRAAGAGFDPVPLATFPLIAAEPALGDWNGDGIVDVFARTEQGVVVFAGLGNGALAEPSIVLATSVQSLAVFDADTDARSDLAVLTADGFELVLAVDGLRRSLPSPPGATLGLGLHGGDFDGDTLPDLVSVVPDFNVVSWRGPLLDPLAPGVASHVGVARASSVGDVDANGRDDLVVALDAGLVSVLYGSPPAGGSVEPFACETILDPAATSFDATASLAIGDLDGNGNADVAVSDGVGITVLVW